MKGRTTTDGSDFSLIDNTFNQLNASGAAPLALLGSSLLATNVVPEPATLGLLGIALAATLGRRRRRTASAGAPRA